MVSFSAYRLTRLGASIQTFIEINDRTMQTITQEVTRADGVTVVTVTTQRNEGESVEDFQQRHDAVVTQMQNT
jgi:hypothetical protein